MTWFEGRLTVGKLTLDVETSGPLASVSWEDGALVLSGGAVDPSSVEPPLGDVTVRMTIRHSIEAAQQVFVPHLTPREGNVIGDAVFRAPAIVLSDADVALALVADVGDVCALSRRTLGEGRRAFLDYDCPRRTITLGAGSYREEGHVFYVREPVCASDAPIKLRFHVLVSTESMDIKDPYGMAARFLWREWGRAAFERMARPSLDDLTGHVTRWAFSRDQGWGESVWQEVDLNGVIDEPASHRAPAGAPVFIVDVSRHPSVPVAERTWREPRSVWNQAWFSTQRCANGLLRHARHQSKTSPSAGRELEERARKMTEITLAAPMSDGLFPAVLIALDDETPARAWAWINSNRRPSSASDRACHIADAAFTCRMLLEWRELTGDLRVDAMVTSFVRRLERLQRQSGALPGWVEPNGDVPTELAEGPESAIATALLFEVGAIESAVRALPFLESIVRDGRWEDFETYYSCAPWGREDQIGQRVSRNGVYKQNTLSMAWCAEAFLLASRALKERRYLDLARRCVDELVLYQAVWDPPWLPAPAIGGFGVMNADCEWNDARQSLFAPLLLDLGRELGDRDLVERGVAAVRASFSMLYCPENACLRAAYEDRHPFFGPESYGFMMENQGHSGAATPIGTFTIFTWGNGSALATLALVRDRFPDVAREWGL